MRLKRLLSRKYWRLRLLAIGFFVAAMGLAFFGPFDNLNVVRRIRTVPARFAQVDTRLDGMAWILRDEQVVTMPISGRVTVLASDGRPVRVGEILAEVNHMDGIAGSNSDNETLAGLSQAAYDAQRAELERQETDVTQRLRDAESVLKDALTIGDQETLKEAEQRRDQFRDELSRIEQLLIDMEHRRQTAGAMHAAQTPLASPEAAGRVLIRSTTSGVFVHSFDGLEDTFSPGQSFDEVVNVGRNTALSVTRDGAAMESGAPLFRVVGRDKMEAVVRIGRGTLEESMAVELTFSFLPSRTFAGIVTEVDSSARETYVRIRLDDFDTALMNHRAGDVVVSARKAEGIVVPVRSIAERGGRRGVYVMLGDRPVFREIRILGGNDREAVIDGVQGVPVGAPVVLNPSVIQ